jgi:hypothetical protein
VSAGGGQSIETPLDFGSAEWLDAVRHAASEAQRLGLEMAIFSSPGWSETGGPWVTPAQGMKRLVWTETTVEGPRAFNEILPQAPANLDFYADAAVVAFPVPAGDVDVNALQPTVTSSGGDVDAAALMDDDQRTNMTVTPAGDGGAAWVQFAFETPVDARAITLSARAGGRNGVPAGSVLAGDDPARLTPVVSLPGTQLYRQSRVRTYGFPSTRARIWRIEMTGAPLDPARTMSGAAPVAAESYQLIEAKLHTGARVNRWEEKSGGSQFLFEYESVPSEPVEAGAAVDRSRVVDLTSSMNGDGTLTWDVPAGRWTILRMGYVPTGARNRPATASGSGLEADKLSHEHMEAYYHGYFDPLEKALGPLFGTSLRYVLMDSWEAGMQNWTDAMADEFRRRRGYDPMPWLPALAGRVVESADASDRFLWDFRRTLADMWAEYHYGTMTDLLEAKGIGTYAEAAGVSLEISEDTLLNKSKVTIPMGEFWVRDLHPRLMYFQDVRGAASAAHVYGKPLVAAEAFTGGGYESPRTLKNVGDYWMAQGINRIVFHTSAHQPLETKPGNTMVGTHIHRNITWAEQAGPYMTYLARSCYLMQQGRTVADLAYLLGEGAPSTPPIWGAGTTPAPPPGYDYDFINADALLNRMSVGEGGRIALPDGTSYRVLVLPEIDTMRPALLRKLRELVAGGATVVGPRPARSPSLEGFPDADAEVRALAAELWGDLDGVSRTIHRLGDGQVIWGLSLETVLDSIGVAPDLEHGGGLDAEIAWHHRHLDGTEIYYVANVTDAAQTLEARFRVGGMNVEVWHPDTGAIEAASYRIEGDRTVVSLPLDEHELVFVVFRGTANAPSRSIPTPTETTLATIDGPWEVEFTPKMGAPARIEMDSLQSWTENEENGIRFYSGTASYTKTIVADASWMRDGGRLVLDLGGVGDLAEVTVNGKPLGIAWKPPYRIDATGALTAGENRIEIKVTNQWSNRIAGDRDAPVEQKVLSVAEGRGFGGGRFGGGGAASPSGLIGPVRVVSIARP